MKISLPLFFTVILKISSSAELKIEDHVNLISDIYNFYKPSSVIFIHFADKESMIEMNVVFEIILMLSRKNIKTLTMNFEEIPVFKRYYNSGLKNEKHPMSVIFLTSKRAIKKFEDISAAWHLHKSVNLVIFQEILEKPLKDSCINQAGNSLKLKIDTLMLVKCYEENVLRQWYSIYENQTNFYDWAKWDSKTGLLLKANDTFYTRRADLYGKVLRVATVKNTSLAYWKNGLLVGYFGDLLKMLEKSLNFTANFVREETEYGSFDEMSGNWSGAMGLAVRKEVDLVVAGFQMTSQRLEIIDFSTPLFFARTVLYIRKPSTKLTVNWSGHFKPFEMECWSVLILIILIASILLTCVEKHDNGFNGKLSRFSKNYFIVWRIYCQQGLSETSTASSFRIIYFSLLCSAFVIMSIYSASLVSTFAIPTISMPFTSLEGFVKDGSYKLAIIRDSAYSDLFENSNDSTLRDMKKLIIKEEDQPPTVQEGFNMVCHKRVAFYISEKAGEIENINITCKLIKINTGRYDSVAMVLQKESQYTELIKYQLTKFKGNGILDHLNSENFAGIKESCIPEEFNRVDLPGVIILLAITTGGAILGMIIFFGELIYFHYNYEKLRRRKPKDENRNKKLDNKSELNIKILQNIHRYRMTKSPIEIPIN